MISMMAVCEFLPRPASFSVELDDIIVVLEERTSMADSEKRDSEHLGCLVEGRLDFD